MSEQKRMGLNRKSTSSGENILAVKSCRAFQLQTVLLLVGQNEGSSERKFLPKNRKIACDRNL